MNVSPRPRGGRPHRLAEVAGLRKMTQPARAAPDAISFRAPRSPSNSTEALPNGRRSCPESFSFASRTTATKEYEEVSNRGKTPPENLKVQR
jgi:hypothetical protein